MKPTIAADAVSPLSARVHGRGTIRLTVRYLDDALAFDVSDEGTVHDEATDCSTAVTAAKSQERAGLALARDLAISLIRGEGNRLLRLDRGRSSPGPGGRALARCGPRSCRSPGDRGSPGSTRSSSA